MKIVLLLFLSLGTGSVAMAVPITFIHTGTGSGSVGATNFTNADFVITAVGDTTAQSAVSATVFFIDHTSAQIDIAGVGVFTFTAGTRTFVNQGSPIVGFSRAGAGGSDLFNGPVDAQFATWDLLTGIGPVVGTASLLQWDAGDITTSGGVLIFQNGSSASTFEARLGAVPEPSTWLTFLGGMSTTLFLGGRFRRDG